MNGPQPCPMSRRSSARRLAGRCLTAKFALLAGFLALQAAAGAALAQTAAPAVAPPPAAARSPPAGRG